MCGFLYSYKNAQPTLIVRLGVGYLSQIAI